MVTIKTVNVCAMLLFAGAAQCSSTDATQPLPDITMLSRPTITRVVPATLPNTVMTTLILTGTDFRAPVRVQVGGVACDPATVVSPTRIDCPYPGNPRTCGGQLISVSEPVYQVGTLSAEMGLNLTSPTLFADATNFPVGASPAALVVGDFNADQKPDLAVLNGNSNNVSVLLGDGMGGFAAATDFAAAVLYPRVLVVGDFNSDQRPDLVVAEGSLSSKVNVLLGDGKGGFSAYTRFSVGYAEPTSLVIGDFNADQKPDLVVALLHSNDLNLLLGDGMGGFAAPVNLATGIRIDPASIVVGDFNADQKLDIVALTEFNHAGIFLGDGTGGFAAPTSISLDSTNRLLAVGDFNGDRLPDLASSEGNNVIVMLGDRIEGFAAAVSFPVDATPNALAVGDFDGDGQIDLAAATGGNTVSVLLQKCH